MKIYKFEKDLIKKKEIKKKINSLEYNKNNNVTEWEKETPKDIRDGALRDVINAYKTGFSQLSSGLIKYFNLQYRKKNKNQTIVLSKKTLKLNKKFLNISYLDTKIKIRNNKKLNHLNILYDCRLNKINNEYFLYIPVNVERKKDKKINNFCGIDPGVRTFLTTFGNKEIFEIYHDENLIKKLNKKLDLLKKNRKRKKYLTKIEKRKNNVIDELHWKSINFLINTNEIIFMGDIKSHDIVKDGYNKKLNRNMMDLKFFKFKERLRYKCLLNGVIYIPVPEPYTTQGCSSCGILHKKIGSSKIFSCPNCKKEFDRDVNSAKNIMMKGLLS